jgi:hypothetical protein
MHYKKGVNMQKPNISVQFLLFLVFSVSPFSAIISQEPTILWQSFHDGPINSVDYFKHMVVDNDGNTFVLCGTKGDISQYDVNITTYKIDTSGQIEWVDNYNGPGTNSLDSPIDIVYDPNGYVISMGKLKGAGMVVIKYDLTGQKQWVYQPSDDDDYAYTMTIDDEGNIYIAGKSKVPNSGNYIGLIIKLSPGGSQLFRNEYKYGGTVLTWNVKIIKMITDLNGNLLVVGDCKRTTGSYYSCFIAKIDQSGTEQWNYVHLSDSLYMGSFYQANICTDADNNVYAASPASVGENDYSDYLVFRLDNSNGNISWSKKLDGGNGGSDNVKSIHADNIGNIYLSGYSRYSGPRSSHVLIKMNSSNGNLLWEKEIRDYGTAGFHKFSINDFCLDDMGNFYISFPDIIDDLKKYTPEGDILWSKDVPGAFRGSDYTFDNWMDIHISAIIKDNNGKIYFGCSGTEGGNSDLTDVMVAVLTEDPTSVGDDDHSFPSRYSLAQNYPNPFNPSTKIRFRISEFGFVRLKIYDVLGNEVATLVNEEKPAESYEVNFDANNLSSGIYFYKLQAESFVATKKMVLLR